MPSFDRKAHRAGHNNLKTVVTEHGQITIPKQLRDKMGLISGTIVEWGLENDRVFLTKESTDIMARIEKIRGILKKTFPCASTDDFINDIRGSVE